MSPSTAQLEQSLKETLQTLSQILTFYSSVQSLSATPYASTAPRLLTDKLGKCVEDYQKACDELETKVLRALAILERDSRKTTGLSPLGQLEGEESLDLSIINTNATGSVGESPLASIPPFPDVDTSNLVPLVPDGIFSNGIAAAASNTGDDMDDFLNDSLFGDSRVTSPIPPVDNAQAPVIYSDLSALIASLGTKLPTPSSTSTQLPSTSSTTDLLGDSAMAELLNQYTQNTQHNNSSEYPMMDLDLSTLGVDFTGGGILDGGGGLLGSSEVMDYSLDLDQLPNLGPEELDDLLRRLDSAV